MTLSQPLFAAFVDCIAERHGVTAEQVMGRSTREPVKWARFECYWHLRQAGRTWEDIALLFDRRHHTVVLRGFAKWDGRGEKFTKPFDWAALEALVREAANDKEDGNGKAA